jgi:hypothetical protein
MKAGPFRIEKAATGVAKGGRRARYLARVKKPAATVAADTSTPNALSDYMDRLIRLIPGEALGVYLTIRGFWLGPETTATGGQPADNFVDYLPAIGILLLLVSRILGTRNATGSFASVQWGGTLLAVIAFILWVLAMGHRPFGWELDGRITSTLVDVFSFMVPYVYKGE